MTSPGDADPTTKTARKGCCTVARRIGGATHQPKTSPSRGLDQGMEAIPEGTFLMGTNDKSGVPGDGEGPVREARVGAFGISSTAVSNAEFTDFVADSGYVTEAEGYEWSYVFVHLVSKDTPSTRAPHGLPWWRQVFGADWRHPYGPSSDIVGLESHPVVHVSWNDAVAYCNWAGCRLPTEAEWEYAARGGLVQKRYVWGDEFEPGGRVMCNIFKGDFPNVRPGQQVGTSPVLSYPPNGYGLFNMAGNVWEWCADWYGLPGIDAGVLTDPTGPPDGAAKVMRGGSYLCHPSYCNRYRVAARSSNTPQSSAGNIGFRIAAD